MEVPSAVYFFAGSDVSPKCMMRFVPEVWGLINVDEWSILGIRVYMEVLLLEFIKISYKEGYDIICK